jgi:hypothetical protein
MRRFFASSSSSNNNSNNSNNNNDGNTATASDGATGEVNHHPNRGTSSRGEIPLQDASMMVSATNAVPTNTQQQQQRPSLAPFRGFSAMGNTAASFRYPTNTTNNNNHQESPTSDTSTTTNTRTNVGVVSHPPPPPPSSSFGGNSSISHSSLQQQQQQQQRHSMTRAVYVNPIVLITCTMNGRKMVFFVGWECFWVTFCLTRMVVIDISSLFFVIVSLCSFLGSSAFFLIHAVQTYIEVSM